MDVTGFLKTVPAVIGVAGMLTYLMRERTPASDVELVNIVQNVRNTFVLVGCAALIILSAWLIFRPPPPDHDAPLPGEHASIVKLHSHVTLHS
jgi:hypothetical protein